MSAEEYRWEEEHVQDMTYITTQMDLIIKYLLAGGVEIVKVIGS